MILQRKTTILLVVQIHFDWGHNSNCWNSMLDSLYFSLNFTTIKSFTSALRLFFFLFPLFHFVHIILQNACIFQHCAATALPLAQRCFEVNWLTCLSPATTCGLEITPSHRFKLHVSWLKKIAFIHEASSNKNPYTQITCVLFCAMKIYARTQKQALKEKQPANTKAENCAST